MPYFAITVMLCIGAFAMSNLLHRHFCVGMVSFLGLLLLVAYVCGILNVLPLSLWLGRLLVLAAAGYCGYRLLLKRNLEWKSAIVPMLLFAAGSALIWWICRGRLFNDWDEFSHWGLSLKYLFYNGALYSEPGAPTNFKSYPPIYTLGQYILSYIPFSSYREDVLMFTSGLLNWAFLCYPLKWLSLRRRPVATLGTAVLLFFMPCVMFDHAYYRVSPDMLLGVLVGFLLCVLTFEEDSRTRKGLLCMGLFLLTLTKSSGTGLSILCCLCVIVYFFVVRKQRSWQIVVVPLAVVAASKLSWNIYLQAVGASERWALDLASVFTPAAYRSEVLSKFAASFFKIGNYGTFLPFAPGGWLVILMVCTGLLYAVASKEMRPKLLYANGCAIVVFICFSLFMLLSYLYLFAEIEAAELASFYRYMATPICAVLYVLVVAAGNCITSAGAWTQLLIVPLLLMGYYSSVLPGLYVTKILQAPLNAAQTQHDRYLAQRTARYISALGEQNPRLYLITADDAGWMQSMIGYELYPIQLPQQQTILACHPKENEPWVQQITPEEWSALLAQDYDYVYIYCPEDQFVADYLSLFEDESQVVVNRMFVVVRQDETHALLRRILVDDQTE